MTSKGTNWQIGEIRWKLLLGKSKEIGGHRICFGMILDFTTKKEGLGMWHVAFPIQSNCKESQHGCRVQWPNSMMFGERHQGSQPKVMRFSSRFCTMATGKKVEKPWKVICHCLSSILLVHFWWWVWTRKANEALVFHLMSGTKTMLVYCTIFSMKTQP